jgi:hypothetical protein
MNKDYFAIIEYQKRRSFSYAKFCILFFLFFLLFINRIDSKVSNQYYGSHSDVCLSTFFMYDEDNKQEITELDFGNTVLWSIAILSLLLNVFIGVKAFSKSEYVNNEVKPATIDNTKIDLVLSRSNSQQNKLNDIINKINEFEKYFDGLDKAFEQIEFRLKRLEPSNFGDIPPFNSNTLQETKKEIIYYSETPERDGSFMIADLKSKKSNLTIYKIIRDANSGDIYFDLDITNTDILKRVINLSENLLKPVCEFVNAPTSRSIRVVKVSKESGRLEERGGRYYVTEKIKIRFED